MWTFRAKPRSVAIEQYGCGEKDDCGQGQHRVTPTDAELAEHGVYAAMHNFSTKPSVSSSVDLPAKSGKPNPASDLKADAPASPLAACKA